MEDLEIIGTFESEETTDDVTRVLNTWFQWVFEGGGDSLPEALEDAGVDDEQYAITDGDVDWEEAPFADARGNKVIVQGLTDETEELVSELVESLGAYDVYAAGDDED